MKSYRELADKVFERRDKYLVARKRKRKKIIKRTSATACALVVVLGISSLHLDWFKPDVNDKTTIYSQTNPQYNADKEYTVSILEVPTTTTTTKHVTTQKTTPISIDIPKLTIPIYNPLTTTTKPIEYFKYEKNADFRYYMGWTVQDWLVEGDIVHIMTKMNYVVLDTNTGVCIRSMSFSSIASKMRIVEDELWVSLQKARVINVYDKETLELKRQIQLEHTIKDFDVCDNYIVYADESFGGYSGVYRYDVNTKATVAIPDLTGKTDDSQLFREPSVLVNAQDGLVYVGESGCLYYIDLETLEFRKGRNMAGTNIKSRMYLCKGYVYWGRYKLHATTMDVNKTYLKTNRAGILYTDGRYTVHTDGVYNALYKTSLYMDLSSVDCGAMMTKSGNLVVVRDSMMTDGVVYIVKDAL